MPIIELTDVQQALREVARDVLTDRSAPAQVRAWADDPHGFDPDLWLLAGELGWFGLEVSEALGGSGQGLLETSLLLRELGRTTTPGPYLSQSLAVTALLARTDHEAAGAWLPRLAAGEAIGAVGLGTLDQLGRPTIGITAASTPGGRSVVLSGRAHLVPDAGSAHLLVLVAEDARSPIVVALTEPQTRCAITWRPTTDQTRRLYDVELDHVEVAADHVLVEGDAARALVAQLWRRAAVGIALDSVGGAAKVLEMTVAYTSQRVQFGRPIATFQAVKHLCADMLVEVETARIATDAAVLALGTGAPDGAYWAALAKARSGDAGAQVAGDGLQLHGGIGMTWEFDLHLWLKRAKLNQALYGSSDSHRALIATSTQAVSAPS